MRDGTNMSPAVGDLASDGGGYGRRVSDDVAVRVSHTGGKKRGRPPKTNGNVDVGSSNKKTRQSVTKRLRWTDTGREEFDREQKKARMASTSCDVRKSKFGRGEGGGVT